MRTKEVRKYYNILVKRSAWFRAKRILDVIVASIMFAVLALPMLIVAVLIKLDSPGPVFFRQERVTQYGRIFRIYKFRTMVNNASRMGTQVTVSNDARITRVGRWLRKLRIDEFPQLFNILAGDMTLVGTRPEVLKYVNQIDIIRTGLRNFTVKSFVGSAAPRRHKIIIHCIIPCAVF